MDLSKFTERARGVIQNAQTLATVQDHQRFMPVHLLKEKITKSFGRVGAVKTGWQRCKSAFRGAESGTKSPGSLCHC